MSRITAAAELSRDELADAPDEEWIDTLLEKDNQLGRQVVSNINQNLPFLNCPTSQLNEPLQMVHGVPLTIKNPLNTPIRSVMAVACIGLSVDSTGKPTRGTYNLGLPQLEWHPSGKQDGSVVVTANFVLQVGETISVVRTSNTGNFTTGVEADVTWSGVTISQGENTGDAMSWDGSTGVVINKAGLYSVHGHASWANSAAGNRQAHINLSGPGRTFSSELPTSSGGNFMQQDAFGVFGVTSVPLTITFSGSQNSGGNLVMNGSGGLTQRSGEGNRTFLQVVRMKNLETPTGKVTLFFAGGE